MSASSDFNMLWLKAPRDMLQIMDGTAPEKRPLNYPTRRYGSEPWSDNKSRLNRTSSR